MHIVYWGSLAASAGGPAYSLALSARGLIARGHQCRALMTPTSEAGIRYPEIPHAFVHAGISGAKIIAEQIAQWPQVDICHIQGLWQYGGHLLASYARRHRLPYVVTLRGMLYPQALAQKTLKKKLALLLYQNRDLRQAACIQVTCAEELRHFRDLGFRTPAALIPNAVELPDPLPEPTPPSDVFRIGYLGRLHPRKQVERLIYALAELPSDRPSELMIIGSGDEKYTAFLKREVERLNLSSRVRFTGFLTGEEKAAALRQCSLIAIPSDFENFGNIVLDALALGIPVVSSLHTPWAELNTRHCGWHVANDVRSLGAAFAEAAALSESELAKMGRRGQQLLQERYDISRVSEQLEQTYMWCRNEISRPEFIDV